LHPATNEELYLLQRHFGFFLAKERSEGNFGRTERGGKPSLCPGETRDRAVAWPPDDRWADRCMAG
jgi:hypothetical protein